jgi:hypothetical protein
MTIRMEKATMRLNVDIDDEARGKLVPTIILVILPGILFVWLFSNWIYHPHSHPIPYTALGYVLLIAIPYGLYALRKKSFKNRMVIEFEYVKNIILVEISILVAYIVLFRIHMFWQVYHYLPVPYVWSIFWFLGLSLLYVVPGGLLWIILHLVRKEFRFYFAKACFIMSKEKDDYEKVKYLLMGLNSYNKYLRRKLRLEIEEVKRIYSKFVFAEIAEKREIVKSVCESVETEDLNTTNILKLAKYLSTLSKIPETELFVETTPVQKLKLTGTILVAVIPIIISAIELFKSQP